MSSSAGSAALHEASALSPDGGGACRQLQMRSRAVAKTLHRARSGGRTSWARSSSRCARTRARNCRRSARRRRRLRSRPSRSRRSSTSAAPSPGGARFRIGAAEQQARAERAALNKVVLLEVAREEKRTAQLTAKLIELREMLRTSRARVAALKKAAGQPAHRSRARPAARTTRRRAAARRGERAQEDGDPQAGSPAAWWAARWAARSTAAAARQQAARVAAARRRRRRGSGGGRRRLQL